MSELIKRLKREIKHTKEAFAAAWKIRQPIRRSAISQAKKSRVPEEDRISPTLTLPEANAFLKANEHYLTAQEIYNEISSNPDIIRTLTRAEQNAVERLGKEINMIAEKGEKGRAIPTMANSGFRHAPPISEVLSVARDVAELAEQLQPAEIVGDRSFVIMENYDPEEKAQGSRKHVQRRRKRHTQRRRRRKRRTRRRRKPSRGKTRRRRR